MKQIDKSLLYSNLYGTVELDDNNIVVDKANSLFVATNGSDSSNGTYTSPFKTLQYALSKWSSGKTIYIRGGTYSITSSIAPVSSGTSSSPCIIRNYPNEKVIFDCANLPSSASYCFNFNRKSNIYLIGIDFIHMYQKSSSATYVVLFNGGEENCILANCEISESLCLDAYNALNSGGSLNDILNSNTYGVDGTLSGIKVFGLESNPCNHILIENCIVHDIICGWSEGITVTANSEYVDIINCEASRCHNIGFDVAGNFGDYGVAEFDRARYVSIINCKASGNVSPNAWCAGIYVDGASNLNISGCESYGNTIGIEIGAENDSTYNPSNITVENSLIHDNSVKQLSVGGYSADVGTVNSLNIRNNTIVNATTSESSALCINKVDGVEIYNNIISDLGSESYLINGDLSNQYVKNVTFKNNVLYHKTKNDNVSLISFALVLYTANSFLALQNVINCQVVDPLLNVDFSLAENSPCIDAGLAYSNKAYDFNGQTRVSNGKIDIGAIEKILTEDVIKAFYYNSDRIVKIYFGENPIAKLN